ncbi:2-keto-3-deoxygluconate permease [Bariatricus massiliensis]|uniref:2-keto-3-deoxygluconate permease n=1 Tax=Bariatricus massiliensis TaxID=1745713 RepID=A0ABS8DGT6_9FIRM|nr:2-keto-3-deoxygluconate permease [Bariatricus massiliensis]MCB7304520.1 2-keto-3-deoxygluconate permease [Bariatricus massiliensis]MCB7375172.1 2-keto-3-deoxygluconate permease [Bariatricus massiliensis]MCB7387631.1 2-keto-3-deoxygluconate permease [Bariatricus massiliensis]MCB7411792.1 2-keto-3-deoxygluconate permease [Bariatricus massiliensis]MCQ5253928.1 2-keto-3-deoxygluconate permease [Bariatricus massiliensis]
MKICATMKKFPGGMMVIPLLVGCLVNTFIPQCLEIGGFTTALFKGGQATLVGLFIFCSGATINVKQVGQPLYKGAVLTILKLIIGVVIGFVLNKLFGPVGILGLTPFAVISAVTNSNGAIYTALAKEFGDETDVGAIAVLSLNDGPFLTMIALGTTGLASIPLLSIVAAIVPLIIGMILGNLDPDFRDLLSKGLNMILPINGFVFGANMSLVTIVKAGVPGILLGVITVLSTGVLTYYLYSAIRRKPDPMGMAIGTVGGNAVATPAAVAMADPALEPYAEAATAQTAAAVVITAILTPILTGWFSKKAAKKIAAKEQAKKAKES